MAEGEGDRKGISVETTSKVDCGGCCGWNLGCWWSCCRKKKDAEDHDHSDRDKWRVYEALFMACELGIVLLYVTCSDY